MPMKFSVGDYALNITRAGPPTSVPKMPRQHTRQRSRAHFASRRQQLRRGHPDVQLRVEDCLSLAQNQLKNSSKARLSRMKAENALIRPSSSRVMISRPSWSKTFSPFVWW